MIQNQPVLIAVAVSDAGRGKNNFLNVFMRQVSGMMRTDGMLNGVCTDAAKTSLNQYCYIHSKKRIPISDTGVLNQI